MENQERIVKKLITFFTISNAAFDFVEKVTSLATGENEPNQMRDLHRQALTELEKETPDFTLIDSLLEQMENEAERTTTEKKPFKVGAKARIVANTSSHDFNIGEVVKIIGRINHSTPVWQVKSKRIKPDWRAICESDAEII